MAKNSFTPWDGIENVLFPSSKGGKGHKKDKNLDSAPSFQVAWTDAGWEIQKGASYKDPGIKEKQEKSLVLTRRGTPAKENKNVVVDELNLSDKHAIRFCYPSNFYFTISFPKTNKGHVGIFFVSFEWPSSVYAVNFLKISKSKSLLLHKKDPKKVLENRAFEVKEGCEITATLDYKKSNNNKLFSLKVRKNTLFLEWFFCD